MPVPDGGPVAAPTVEAGGGRAGVTRGRLGVGAAVLGVREARRHQGRGVGVHELAARGGKRE